MGGTISGGYDLRGPKHLVPGSSTWAGAQVLGPGPKYLGPGPMYLGPGPKLLQNTGDSIHLERIAAYT